MDGIYPSLNELKRDMDSNMLQGLLADRDLGIQRDKEMEGSIGLVLQSLNKLEIRLQTTEANGRRRSKDSTNHIDGG